jgi:hypothetical protein
MTQHVLSHKNTTGQASWQQPELIVDNRPTTGTRTHARRRPRPHPRPAIKGENPFFFFPFSTAKSFLFFFLLNLQLFFAVLGPYVLQCTLFSKAGRSKLSMRTGLSAGSL